ncbi:MAG TPA: phage baseplate assembly protein V [Solirubrobacteraceae bacterium]|nr:phage baseplate assembly protein V [Solirubrobacteraceae bacterium]
MSGALFDSVARIARHEAGARALPAVGTVTATFGGGDTPPDHAASVQLRDSGVVLPRVPIAVGALGFAALPATGDLVVVAFLGGDANAPVVVGRLYTDATPPPAAATDDTIALALPAGGGTPALKLAIAADGTTGVLEVGGEPVKLEVDDQHLTVKVGALEVSVTKAGGGRVELKAGSTEVTLKQDGDLALKTQGKLRLEGSEVEIAAQAQVKVNGAVVKLN